MTGRTFEAINPATGEVLSTHHEAGPEDVETAAVAAVEAFEHTRDLPHGWQATLLEGIAEAVMELGDALLEKVQSESALPRARVTGERGRTTGQLKMFAAMVREGSWVEAVIDTADPTRAPAPKPDLRRMLVARGPVAVFGASNFPLAFGAIGGDTASALAAGCPVIVKGHPSHPGTSEWVGKAVHTAIGRLGLPSGLFTLLQGKSHELSGLLVTHPAVEAVGFTGSQKAGRALFDLAAGRERPIPVYAEMGNLNPLVLMPGAIAERGEEIAKGLAGSVLMGAGQFCTKPGIVLAIGDGGAFTELLAKQVSAAAGFTMLNAGLRNNFCERATKFGKVGGVKTVVGGAASGHAGVGASLFETDVETFLKEGGLREEAFGPAAVVVRCEDVGDALLVLQHVGGSLTGTAHIGKSDDVGAVKRVLRGLQAVSGRVIVNGYPTGVEVNQAIVHGGPYPATTDAGSTSVGTAAVRRFTRMAAWQDVPDDLLPVELQDRNPTGIWRTIDGERTKGAVARR